LLAIAVVGLAVAAEAAEVITVKVVDVTGAPLIGAKVGVTRTHDSKFVQGDGVMSTSTNREGLAEFGNLIAGWYTVNVRMPGFIPVQLSDIPVDYTVVPRRKIDVLVVTLNPIKQVRH
jgi:hypothetical protein